MSEREQRVVELLLQGCDNSAIALELGIAERTVKGHLNHMFVLNGITTKIKRVGLAVKFYNPPAQKQAVRPETLSALRPRLRTIIPLVAAGMCNAQIAERLGTTEDAVKNCLREIFDALGVWNRVEVALWYLRHAEALHGRV